MKNHILYSAVMFVATVGVVACSDSHKNEEMEAPVINVAEVTVDSVTTHLSYPAYLTADQEVALVARVNGYLRTSPYESGQFVRKGTVLFTIESDQYADAVRQAQAALNNARSASAYAVSHYEAMKKAYASDAVSRMELLQAQSDKEQAEAQVASAAAQLKTAQTTLSYCTVLAPFDGHVSSCAFSNGSFLAGEGSPVKLATIYDDALMTVHFSMDEAQYTRMFANNNVSGVKSELNDIPVTFDAPLGHSYTAYMSYVAPSISKATGSIDVEAKIKNEYNELRSGMYCTVNMPQENVSNAMLVRDASIATDQLGKYMYVVNDSNKVVYTPVKVGELVNDTLRIITSGLKPGQKYVTAALLKVRDGMTVKPQLVK